MRLSTKFDNLETKRLRLRLITTRDAAATLKLRSDPSVMQYIRRPMMKSLAEARAFIKQHREGNRSGLFVSWAIELRSRPGEMIGHLGFWRIDQLNHRAELGYMLLPQFHGKGLMREAVSRSLDTLFDEFKFHSVEARVEPANKASRALLKKLGFRKVGRLREDQYTNRGFVSTDVFDLLEREWRVNGVRL